MLQTKTSGLARPAPAALTGLVPTFHASVSVKNALDGRQETRHNGQIKALFGRCLVPGSGLAFLVLCILVSGCSQVQNKEDMLAAAGFTVVPANTPQRQASLRTMPPHKFVQQTRNNAVIFTYADPTICDCLYVGNQAAYDRYRRDVFDKNLANEERSTAQMDQSLAWDAWGPGWWYY